MCDPIPLATQLSDCETSDNWCTYNCPETYQQTLYNTGGNLLFSSEGLTEVQASVNNLFTNYLTQYQLTDDTSSPSYNPFQQQLQKLCLNPALPGACDSFLSSYCPQYSVADMNSSAILTSLCGCYLAPPCNDQNCNPACQPPCNLASTVKKSDSQGNLIRCPANICVINDVTVNAINNQTQGQVNIVNVCPGCVNQSCTCIISSASVNNLLGSVGLTTNVANFCGPNSTYEQVNPDGSVTTLTPDQISGQITTNPSNPPQFPWTVFLLIILIAVIGFGIGLIGKAWSSRSSKT